MSSKVPENIEALPIEVRGMFPGPWWNEDSSEQRENRVSELEETVPNADAIGVVDTDADGLACEVVLNDKYENPVVIQANGGANAISLGQAFKIVGRNASSDTPVIVADLSPDSTFSAFLASLSKVDSPIHLFDHHDWKWSARTSIEAVVEEIVVEEGKCAAQILQENHHTEADDTLREFVDVTADHDLWLKEDSRSDHLSTLAFNLDRNEYVEAALEYGADMVKQSEELSNLYTESERRADKIAETAVNRAEWLSVGDTEVAVTYFDCHQSRVGDTLLDNGADLAVIIQPTLSISFRSTEEFDRCAEFARGLGGGGHPTAAGAGIYHEIEVPEKVNPSDIYIPELDGDRESFEIPENLETPEYVWRTQGQPAVSFMKDYVRRSV